MTRQIGRFDIRGELGHGAQSTVYLAFDPKLQRQVAIKTLHFTTPDPGRNRRLLDEARLVSPLRHPHIVPIFDAGEVGGDPYLVFEYVPGETLALFLRQAGALSPVRAIAILRPVLDAVTAAHRAGIIHRDLKPSNILLDEDGSPRVMDFGIASRSTVADGENEPFTGTPAYLSPEYIARRHVSEQGDIFAAGLILYEMLVGQRAAGSGGIREIMQRLRDEDIRLPGGVEIDEALAAIVHKAVARDPALRYETAEQFAAALDHFLAPEVPDASEGGRPSTLDFLLRRMRHRSDFPALSESVAAINKIASSETERIDKLSNTILKDFSLTNKLLRLVNSAYFRPAGAGSISTISRAVIVLGFEAVRNIAITVLLFEHMQNKANVRQLKEDFLRANLAGMLARDIAAAAKWRDLEQSFLCALFHSLGRLLIQFYFPEEAEQIRRQMAQSGVNEETATQQILGISSEALGIGVAQSWGFPPLLVHAMRKLPDGPLRQAGTTEERLRLVSGFANEFCAVIAQATAETRDNVLRQLLARFGTALSLKPEGLRESLQRSAGEIGEFARIIHLDVAQTAFGKQVRQFMRPAGLPVDEPPEVDLPAPGLPGQMPEGEPGGPPPDAQSVLTAGIQDISNTLVEGFKLNDILRIILETMYRAMGFRRVLLCIKDARSGTMQGRFGFGPDAQEVARHFRFPLAFAPDIFHAATDKGVDVLIRDIDDPKIASRIPEWYRKAVPARSFVLFPLNIKGVPVALIYADQDESGAIDIPEKELSLLRTLRNQAILAIKQGS